MNQELGKKLLSILKEEQVKKDEPGSLTVEY